MTFRFLFLALLLFFSACAVRPPAQFTIPAQKLVAPVSVTFQAPADEETTYSWDFGDGSTAKGPNPAHRYQQSGNYTVTLIAAKGKKTTTTSQILQVLAPDRCVVEIETDWGIMLAELSNMTPLHRDNFLKLASEGYYNGTLFHRVINGFMIQGGDPVSRDAKPGQSLGMGGPGYQIPAEITTELVHHKGAIAAARTNNPEKKSSGSQFYIVQGSPVKAEALQQIESARGFHYSPEQRAEYLANGGTPHLDREYTVFGRIIEGLDVLDKIAAIPTDRSDRPTKDIKMKITPIY